MSTRLWKDEVFADWWPLGQSMVLVRAPFREATRAMRNQADEWSRRVGATYRFDWLRVSCIDEWFRCVEEFTIVPSMHCALPTNTDWTVMWCNSFLCAGHPPLAHCLTESQQLETIHFYSTDRNSTQLAGTHFTYRKPTGSGELTKRDVYCCNQGSRWDFRQEGEPLPEEDLERYSARRKRDRLCEESLMALLERLGVQPWLESTYEFRSKLLRMTDKRSRPPSERFTFRQVRERAGGPPPEEDDDEPEGAPDYLLGKCQEPNGDGPARLLADGRWCGHGEPTFRAYAVSCEDGDRFVVRLPQAEGPSVVEAQPVGGRRGFAIYDSRRHPASVSADSGTEPTLLPPERCPKCGSTVFLAAVGFEVPVDAQSANDTSWFALALECGQCRSGRIAYEHETA